MTMAIISQETWDNLTEETKENIRRKYNWYQEKEVEEAILEFEDLFNKENLQSKNDSEIILYGLSGRNPQSEAIAEKCVEPIKEHFNKETQDYKWSQLSEDDKDYYQVLYADPNTRKVIKEVLIRAWGEHNLQPNKIKTWEDVERENPKYFKKQNAPNPMLLSTNELRDKLGKKVLAMYEIAILIDLGYGGMVTEEEWKDDKIEKFNVVPFKHGGFQVIRYYSIQHKDILSFRDRKTAEEFMSYPENRALAERYYMI